MNLDLNRITEKLQKNEIIQSFINELNQMLEKMNKKNDLKEEIMDDIRLSQEEELNYYKKEMQFLQDYFQQELSNGEVFIVTDKYQNDELNRYKITQYKNNLESKYVVLKQDLPQNIQIGDIVRKEDGTYVLDEEATKYVQECKEKIKQEVISERK